MHQAEIMQNFFQTIIDDPRISSHHICLYLVLLHLWKHAGSPGIFELDRNLIMQLAKISSRATYDKCMHALHELGYIKYQPAIGYGKSKIKFSKL